MTQESVVVFLNLRRTSLEYCGAIDAAERLGYRVALVADSVPRDLPPNRVSMVRQVDTYDPEAVDSAVHGVRDKYKVAGVVTWSDRDVETVARLADWLDVPGPSPTSARAARNKVLMREALGDVPWTTPIHARVGCEGDVDRAAAKVGFPGVLKPSSGSGSKGIFVVRDNDELKAAFNRLSRYVTPSEDKIFTHYPGELIYEELMTGTEHSVEGLVSGGEISIVGVTDKVTLPPYQLEVGHVFPSTLPKETLAEIDGLTLTILKTLGLDNCAFHLECMVQKDGVRLVEVAARTGGDFIASHLVGLSTGTPFCENVIRVATGQQPVPHAQPSRYSGVQKIMADRPGVFLGASGCERAMRKEGVVHVVMERQPGAMIRLPPDDYVSSTLGAVIAVGESAAGVRNVLNRAVQGVSVRITGE